MWDQEVVIPHEGHRMPKNCTIVQSGNPSCLCVPMPRRLGVRQAAVIKRPTKTLPASTIAARCIQPIRTGPQGPRAEPAAVGGGE
jgi:hypothetical protein